MIICGSPLSSKCVNYIMLLQITVLAVRDASMGVTYSTVSSLGLPCILLFQTELDFNEHLLITAVQLD